MKLAFHVANVNKMYILTKSQLPIMRILGECWVNCDVNLEVPSYRQINTSDFEDLLRFLAFDMVDMDMGGGVLISPLFQNLTSFNGPFSDLTIRFQQSASYNHNSKFLESPVQIFLEHQFASAQLQLTAIFPPRIHLSKFP